MQYHFSLETKSFLLSGSGEGGVLIDADVIFHPTGFPYIPAKRVKGMLRESMQEILEILGKDEVDIKDILKIFFGEPGRSTYEGKLTFRNLYIPDWSNILAALASNTGTGAFHPDFIKSCFTTEIQQTALDEEGIAKKRSLRNYRVINPDQQFETLIESTQALTEKEWGWLQKAVRNLRHAGTRRNRGLGRVDCRIEKKKDSEKLVLSDQQNSDNAQKIGVSITTVSPIVLALQLGEQNTVFTSNHISGNHLRGLLANAYIRKEGIKRTNAHLSDNFYDFFLSGRLQFGDLTLEGCKATPLHIHNFKLDKSRVPVSVFTEPEGITKSIGGQGVIAEGVVSTHYTTRTTFNFHNSRENRSAGRNTEKDKEGGIFYYESINEGQTFKGEISGDANLIGMLSSAFATEFPARLGRSKSVQYGEVAVSFKPTKNTETAPIKSLLPGQYVLTLESPLVLLNENGMPLPDKTTLQSILPEGFVIKNAAAALTTIEQFNATWQSKSGKVTAYKEGSSFFLELASELTLDKPIEFLGEWREQGFGKVRLDAFDKNLTYKKHDDTNNDSKPKSERSALTIPLLVQIQDFYSKQEQEIGVKTHAVADALKWKLSINNHQIGRLGRLFESNTEEEQIKKWTVQAVGKPAEETLKKLGIINDDRSLNLSRHHIDGFPLQRIYWISFFRTLRKNNKIK